MFNRHPAGRPRAAAVPGLYHVHHGDVFLPGAGNVVFEPKFALPPIQLIGAGIYAGALRVTQGPQIRTTYATTTAGLGGLVAGQIITQPLNTPEVGNGSE